MIQCENLRKVYGNRVVGVEDISLSVEEGEFVTLLGPSGCGKTTLLRLIAGFETPTAGRIRLAGRDVTDLPPYRRDVNTVFQDYALFPHMTVGENVGYGLKVAGKGWREVVARANESLDLVGLADKVALRPHELSGGQRQRVALARAIVRRPKVLLLDEPLSALDAKLREQMQTELRRLHQVVGLTFIMVTHDQSEAMVMSDRIVLLDRGLVAQIGTPDTLYDHPLTPYVADFIGSTNFIDGRVDTVRDGVCVVSCGGQTLNIATNGYVPSAGMLVVLGMRPEKARLITSDLAAAAPNQLAGRIEDILLYGLSARVTLRLDTTERFVVQLMLPHSRARAELPGTGARVAVELDSDTIMMFPPGTAP